MGWVQHRPDRTKPWKARIRGADGRERSSSFRLKIDAQKWLNDQQSRLDRGTWADPAAGRTPFREVANTWLRTRSNRRPSTRARDESVLCNLVLPYLGDMAVASIQPSDLQAWVHQLETAKAPATVRKAYQIAAGVLRIAARDRLIVELPTRSIELPTIQHHEPRVLTAEDVLRLGSELDAPSKPVVLLGGFAGLRFGEIAGLQAGDVDVLRRRLRIRRAVADVGGRLNVGPPKTHKARRSVSLPAVVVDSLAHHMGSIQPLEPSDFLFTDSRGNPLRRTSWTRRVFAPAVRRAGLEPLTFHDLRHTHVALLIAQGEHPRAIADRLGHTSVRTVLDVYGHLLPGTDEEIAGRLDRTVELASAAPMRPESGDAQVTAIRGRT